MIHQQIKSGRIAEFLACAIIEDLGWQVSLCQQTGFDLIAFKDQDCVRIQVKGSHIKKHFTKNGIQFVIGMGKDKRLPSIKDYDIACLVSIEHRKAYFLHMNQIKKKTIRKRVDYFYKDNLEESTWNEAIEQFYDTPYCRSVFNTKRIFR